MFVKPETNVELPIHTTTTGETQESILHKRINHRFAAKAAKKLTMQHLKAAGRTFGPVLVALALSPLVAHAQGTVDVSGVTAAMGTIEKSCLLGGALAVVIGIVFGVFQFMGRNISGGFMAIGGGLFAGIVIGFAPQWVSSLTGQSISMVATHAAKVLA